jgi:Ras-related protein Rab-18
MLVHIVLMRALLVTMRRLIAKTLKVGSKLDKASSRAVKYEEGEALASKHGSHFCEASAKTRENVRKPFVDVVDQIVKSPGLMESTSKPTRGGIMVGGPDTDSSGCSC